MLTSNKFEWFQDALGITQWLWKWEEGLVVIQGHWVRVKKFMWTCTMNLNYYTSTLHAILNLNKTMLTD